MLTLLLGLAGPDPAEARRLTPRGEALVREIQRTKAPGASSSYLAFSVAGMKTLVGKKDQPTSQVYSCVTPGCVKL